MQTHTCTRHRAQYIMKSARLWVLSVAISVALACLCLLETVCACGSLSANFPDGHWPIRGVTKRIGGREDWCACSQCRGVRASLKPSRPHLKELPPSRARSLSNGQGTISITNGPRDACGLHASQRSKRRRWPRFVVLVAIAARDVAVDPSGGLVQHLRQAQTPTITRSGRRGPRLGRLNLVVTNTREVGEPAGRLVQSPHQRRVGWITTPTF